MTTSHEKARIFSLCAQIVEEKDSQHLLLLVHELNDVLDATHGRTQNVPMFPAPQRTVQ